VEILASAKRLPAANRKVVLAIVARLAEQVRLVEMVASAKCRSAANRKVALAMPRRCES